MKPLKPSLRFTIVPERSGSGNEMLDLNLLAMQWELGFSNPKNFRLNNVYYNHVELLCSVQRKLKSNNSPRTTNLCSENLFFPSN